MNTNTGSTTQSQHVVPRVPKANSRFNRNCPGLLASLGIAALLLGSAPALAQVLGTASNFAVLGATPSVTNTGLTTVNANVGVYPAASITGFPPGSFVPSGSGSLHLADSVAQQAQADNLTAFGTLTAGVGAAIGPALDDISRCGSIGCSPLLPGKYDVGAADLTGTLTLAGGGTYIFRTNSLTTAAGPGASAVVMNGGSPCDVWWTSAASVAIGTFSAMQGNILAHTSITIDTSASLQGRALAYTGTVTLAGNAITACSGGTAPYAVPGPTHLIINKVVVNNSGGVLTPAAFSGTIGGAVVATGGNTWTGASTDRTLTTVGAYSVTETAQAGYTAAFSAACVGTIAAGETKTCTITNDDIPPAAAAAVPTLSEWAMILLAALLAIAGFVAIRRRAK